MKFLKFEAHFFCKSTSYTPPVYADIAGLMEIFKSEELLPQNFEEKSNDGSNVKRFYFVNPSTNKSIHFKSDRIVFSWDINPVDKDVHQLESAIQEFVSFASDTLNSYMQLSSKEIKSNRLSLLFNFLIPRSTPTSDSAVAGLLNDNIPWANGSLNEMFLRTGTVELLEDTNERINAIVAVNDGVIETNHNGYNEKKPCFLVMVDLNTRPDNSDFRFDKDCAGRVWSKLSSQLIGKVVEVDGFLNDNEDSDEQG